MSRLGSFPVSRVLVSENRANPSTESIQSLALIEKNGPPGGEAPVDPSLASVVSIVLSSARPPSNPSMMKHFSDVNAFWQCPRAQNRVDTSVAFLLTLIRSSSYFMRGIRHSQQSEQPPPNATASSSQAPRAPQPEAAPVRHELPSRPSAETQDSATMAMDRVRQSMSQPRGQRGPRPQAPEVPDAEFDFSKGTETFERERAERRGAGTKAEEGAGGEIGEPENPPHPSLLGGEGASGAGATSPPTYKKDDFFDNLSSASSRVPRNEERHRNFDTFGEAGGARGGRGGGRGGRGRGGYGRGRAGGNGGGARAMPEWT